MCVARNMCCVYELSEYIRLRPAGRIRLRELHRSCVHIQTMIRNNMHSCMFECTKFSIIEFQSGSQTSVRYC